MHKFVLYLLVALLPCMLGYPHFQEQIPNGGRVPHPCIPSNIWKGVGHMNRNGGGMRNPFGLDFEKNGYKWDKCLCLMDSDDDGKTNGQELGDPDCEWEPGMMPKITTLSQITHPGICDPYSSDYCLSVNNWQFCETDEFVCEPAEREGVEEFSIYFPPTPVPPVETTYFCMMLDVPTDGDWHVIGSKPQIDNANVIHHILVNLCSDEAAAGFEGMFDSPSPCGMASETCTGSLPGWTVGVSGDCYGEKYGTPLGKRTGFTKALMQFHYNNPEEKEGYVDGSGMTFFYENRRRPYDAGNIILGPLNLNIPPQQLHWEESSLCSSDCTHSLIHDEKYIVDVFPHMHYLGRGMVIEHWRNGERLPDLINTNTYAYDNPIGTRPDPAIRLLPGDELITRCFFNSMSQEKRTYFGESTQAEMCLAFLQYYPSHSSNELACYGMGEDKSYCEDTTNMTDIWTYSKCNMTEYFITDFAGHYVSLSSVCDPNGLECQPFCQVALDTVHKHPCFQGETLRYMTALMVLDDEWGVPFLDLLNSCDPFEPHIPEKSDQAGELCDWVDGPSTATSHSGQYGAVLIAAALGMMSTFN